VKARVMITGTSGEAEIVAFRAELEKHGWLGVSELKFDEALGNFSLSVEVEGGDLARVAPVVDYLAHLLGPAGCVRTIREQESGRDWDWLTASAELGLDGEEEWEVALANSAPANFRVNT